jgi:hypothetical protein
MDAEETGQNGFGHVANSVSNKIEFDRSIPL